MKCQQRYLIFVNLAPASDTHIEDLYAAGGIKAVMSELNKKTFNKFKLYYSNRKDCWRKYKKC